MTETRTIHGKCGTREYYLWKGIYQRCHSPSNPSYPRYGGRGITMCKRWRESIDAFLEDIGPKPGPGYSLERIKNNQGYKPGNVRWATPAEQGKNRRSNRVIRFRGERLPISVWAARLGVSPGCVSMRLAAGWSVAKALTTPKRPPAKVRVAATRKNRRGARPRHGLADSPEYAIWGAMRQRCNNPHCRGYPRYGGRGIRVCERWDQSFDAFIADVGRRPSEAHSLDRYPDRDGHYEPGNVRWATKKEQGNNTSKCRFITHEGQTLTLSQWAREFSLPVVTLWHRLKAGWSFADAISRKRRPGPSTLAPGEAKG